MSLFPLEAVMPPAQWRLAHIELVNWGTFSGHHSLDVSREGHLVTGASGSGKSSLLDAIAAVITPDKWLRFNAAAQEATAGRGDRTLVSYIRGAWSREADPAEDRTVASYLRPHATWTGILLRYENPEHDPVTLVRLFHIRGTSTDPRAFADVCVITRNNAGLLDFQDYANHGIDVRRLKADINPVVATSARNHGPFYVRLRSLLGISTENALHLLHKTQSAKNLGTLDMLFRTFMLDEPGTFARADNAIEQFDELNEAYLHVVDLRKQADALHLVAEAATLFDDASREQTEAARMQDLVLPYAAKVKRGLAEQAIHDAEVSVAGTELDARQYRAAAEDTKTAWDAARLATLGVGGNDASHLRRLIAEAESRVGDTDDARARLSRRLADVGVAMPHDGKDFAELVVAARRELSEPEPPVVAHGLHDANAEARRAVDALESELDALRHRRSNIGGDLLRVREWLVAELGMPEAALPFAGELIDVRDEHAAWTGAIERVLAPLATALLVREDALGAARRIVNSKNLGVRLVLEAVPHHSDAPMRVADSRSIFHHVHVTQGPFADYLNRRISADFDVACVDHPDELDGVSRGVTIAGLFKRSERRYEKNDRHAVDDRGTWVLGGSNDAKVELLVERLAAARHAHEVANSAVDLADAQRQALLVRRRALEEVAALEYSRIDGASARHALEGLRKELRALVEPDSDLDRALAAERDASEANDVAQHRADEARGVHAEAVAALTRVSSQLADIDAAPSTAIVEADMEVLRARFATVRRSIRLENVDNTAIQVNAALTKEAHSAEAKVRASSSRFVEHATRYCAAWPSQASDLTPSIDDRGGYRSLLDGIVGRGLPEHEANFLRLLRDRSRDTLIHLRDELQTAPRRVEERVGPVNESLLRSPYDADTFLQIRVKTRRSGEVDEFLGDLKSIVDGNWAQETLASSEKRFAVLARVMRRLGSSESSDAAWKRRMLDTREHVTFLAREVTEDGRIIAVHDSSAGLSGGQRQKLVVFCLAAALRYQLSDAEQAVPRYGTIILDEAFDKADANYTRMAMDIFREFGFHMVLATPQKLLQTLEPYIGAITSVSNPTRKSSALAHVVFERSPS